MITENLEMRLAEVRDKISAIEKFEDQTLPLEFQQKYSKLIDDNQPGGYTSIIWNRYTSTIRTSTDKVIYLPNQWFYIAALMYPIRQVLDQYRNLFMDIFSDSPDLKEVADKYRSMRGDFDQISPQVNQRISSRLKDEEKETWFKKFITDYDSWGGGKTIDRGDYHVSPLMKLANLLAETQNGIAEIAEHLHRHPNIATVLVNSINKRTRSRIPLNLDVLNIDLKSQLIIDEFFVKRFSASLLTKPFVILTGLSGSGKTKLAQAFTKWISSDKSQYCIVPVGADWTNREPLLGYPNALSSEEYIKPDNDVLDLLIRANDNPDLPYFLILDEMNLSHVERYFADFLSVMESNEVISLYSGNQRQSSDGTEIPTSIGVPSNLFLIGTVNIDETTYMFSPKVLDRANVIEFRVSSDEITSFLENPQSVDLSQLEGHGAAMAQSFLELAKNKKFENPDLNIINATLTDFFNELKKLGAEFGYRSANEIVRLINQLSVIDAEMEIDQKIDIAIMQKLLPKLHGSRRKLYPVLIALGGFCIEKGSIEKIETDVFEKVDFDVTLDAVKYPISLEKLIRMYKCAVDNGYASYAEA